KPTLFEGPEIPSRSWVSVDEEGRLYRIETDQQNPISIDGVGWSGDIHLIRSSIRTVSDRGMIKAATLAADAVIQGIPCRAGKLVEFAEPGGDLQHCTLSQ